MQDKNSNPLKLFSAAKLDRLLSKTPLPEIITSSLNKDILLKFLLSFITTPSKILSEIKVFDPAPMIKIFSLLSSNLRNLTKSFKFSAL